MSNSHDRFMVASEKALENGQEERAGELALLADLTKGNRQEEYMPRQRKSKEYSGVIASSIVKTPIDFIWEPMLPVGCVTVLGGDSSVGKSTFWRDIVARITTGRNMPDGSKGESGGVVIVSPEENIAGHVVECLEEAGADMNKVVFLNDVKRTAERIGDATCSPFQLPDDIDVMESEVIRIGAALVVIDPWDSVFNGNVASTGRNVGNVLLKLQAMLERQGIAAILVAHYTKGTGKNRKDKIGGPKRFTSFPRSIMVIDYDPNDPTLRVLSLIKHSNVNTPPAQIAFKMGENGRLDYLTGLNVQEAEVQKAKILSHARQDVLDLLNSDPTREFNPREVTNLTALEYPYIRQLLVRMTDSNEIAQPARGLYQAIPLQDVST